MLSTGRELAFSGLHYSNPHSKLDIDWAQAFSFVRKDTGRRRKMWRLLQCGMKSTPYLTAIETWELKAITTAVLVTNDGFITPGGLHSCHLSLQFDTVIRPRKSHLFKVPGFLNIFWSNSVRGHRFLSTDIYQNSR